MNFEREAEAAYLELARWIDVNGLAGYDPFDIRGEDWYAALFGGENRFSYYMRAALYHLEYRLPPVALRKLIGVEPAINAKAVVLMASAWLTRYKSTGDDTSLQRATALLDWLRKNATVASVTHISWGYPFHWNSRVFFPRGTPSGVVTGTIGDAWLTHYETTRDPESLEVANGIARFILDDLNRPIDTPDMLCFSYTPTDDFKVLNASLTSAAFLARLGSMVDNEEMASTAQRAARYVVSEQNADGSFCYWGGERNSHIDHFHTGFVLRHLDTIMSQCSADFIAEPLQRGYEFYKTCLFDDGIPKHTPESLYPIDVHSCAEALICVGQFASRMGGAELMSTVFEFCTGRMRHSDGYYVAEIRRSPFGETRTEIPYMRWGQAWMLLALARTAEYFADGSPA